MKILRVERKCESTSPRSTAISMSSGQRQPLQTSAAAFAAVRHANLIKTAATEPSLYNKLITLYSLHSSTLPCALNLFHNLPFPPTVVSWTSIISATFALPSPTTSLSLFLSMLRHPTLPNQRTVATLLTRHQNPNFTLQLHSLSLKLSLSLLPFAGSAFVTAYSKCGRAEDALKVFDRIPHKDEVCYGAVISGLVRCDHPAYALKLFVGMRTDEKIESNNVTISGALSAVGDLAALEQLRFIHGHTVVVGLEKDVIAGTALVSAYGKAGDVVSARKLFDEMLRLNIFNVVTWNAMLAGYGQQGDWKGTLEVFDKMHSSVVKVDKYTLLAVLSSFSNAGLVVETRRCLEKMEVEYGVKPDIEHYTCLIGTLARVGRLEEAKAVALSMPFNPDDAVWRILLTACVGHRNTDMASIAGDRLLEMNPRDESVYIMLTNVYSATGRTVEAAKVQKSMKNLKLKGGDGRSWIEVRGKVHMFAAGDKQHKRKEEIYAKVGELMEGIRKLGFEGSTKNKSILYHSEKLALGFGLLGGVVPEGKDLRVVKNLRICGDCHEVFKHVSRLVGRKIFVRDVNRYHRFEHGSCSCRDIW